MATQHSLPGTPSRRVLGDLTPRAMNTPSKFKTLESSELTRAQSPLKQQQATAQVPRVFADKENVTSIDAFTHGRKRSIAEVDDAEKVPTAKMVAFEPQQDAIAQLTTAAVQRHTVPLTPSTCVQSTNIPDQQPRGPRRPRIPHRTRNTHAVTALSLPRTAIATLPRLAEVLLRVPRLWALRVPAERARRVRPRAQVPSQSRAQDTHKCTSTQVARPTPAHASHLRKVQSPHEPSLQTRDRSAIRLRAILVA